MKREETRLGDCGVEILSDGELFIGLGKITIGGVAVRSGRLPVCVRSQTFTGLELAALELEDTEVSDKAVRIRTHARFRRLPVQLMRDHSFDPIHDTTDWDRPEWAGEGTLSIVVQPAADSFDGNAFAGLSYHYEYESADVPLFYLLDCASWELDGDIAGATVFSQSSCSRPTCTFEADTAWTTEGVVHWEDAASRSNKIMTHNLPRWASHQAFDYQFKGDDTLLGVFERVDLIRSLLRRDADRPELKTFDKHIFDQTLRVATPAKAILLNTASRTLVGQKNLWTRVIDEVHDRARAEFGLAEEPLIPKIHCNYWDNFVYDDYRKDLLPVAEKLGFEAVFIDNVNKSAMTERCPHKDWHWNMCCGHEYEPAPRLGGVPKLKALVEDSERMAIRLFSWTNNDQALSSPVNASERDEEREWFVKMEDTRLKFGGAYTNVFSILDLKRDGARNYWIECLKKIKEETDLDSYLFDSFYNLGFMPVSYGAVTPTTQWRELLMAFKELQDAGIHFMIESFGPFGEPQHGCPKDYGFRENLFASYKLTVGLGYTTIPTGPVEAFKSDLDVLYQFLAHKVGPSVSLFTRDADGTRHRLDESWGRAHRRALLDYRQNRAFMHKRFLQEDGSGVLWHDAAGRRATLWNFVEREVSLPGKVHDLSVKEDLPAQEAYLLKACHTYAITDAAALPTAV